MEVANGCDFITTYAECEAAAQYLGLPDTSASSSFNNGGNDPPYCYFEGGELKFNSGGKNTGDCGSLSMGSGQYYDKCLCKTTATTTTATTTTTTSGLLGNTKRKNFLQWIITLAMDWDDVSSKTCLSIKSLKCLVY